LAKVLTKFIFMYIIDYVAHRVHIDLATRFKDFGVGRQTGWHSKSLEMYDIEYIYTHPPMDTCPRLTHLKTLQSF